MLQFHVTIISMESKNRKKFSWKKIVCVTAIFFVLYIAACFTPYIKAYPLYPVHIIRCASLPVTGSTFATSFSYSLPGDLHYGPDITVDYFFCSEQEAIAAGFHRMEPIRSSRPN